MTIIPDPDKHNKKLQEYYAKKSCAKSLEVILSELQSKPVGKGLSCFSEEDSVNNNYESFRGLYFESDNSILTGQPAVTLLANNPARASISRPSIKCLAAILVKSGSNVGITLSRASIIVTSQPKAV